MDNHFSREKSKRKMPCDVCPNQSELEKIFAFNYQYCEIWK